MNVLVAATLGLMLATGVAYLREVRRDRRAADEPDADVPHSYAARPWQSGYDPTLPGFPSVGRRHTPAAHANGDSAHSPGGHPRPGTGTDRPRRT